MRYTLQLTGIAILLAVGIGLLSFSMRSIQKTENALKTNLVVSVFMQTQLSDADAQKWGQTLQSRDPEIESFTFISKEQANQEAQKDPLLAKTLMVLRENPFPASYLLRYKDQAWIKRPEPALALRGSPEIQDIRWNPEARSMFLFLHRERLRLERLVIAGCVLLGICILLALRHRFVLGLVILIPLQARADTYDVLLKRYTKQIGHQEQQLKSLKANLERKEREARRWQKESEAAQTQWNAANAGVQESRKKLNSVKQIWDQTRAKANAAEWAVTEQTLLSRAVDGQLAYLARELYQNRWISPSRVALSVTEAAPQILVGRLCSFSELTHHELVQVSHQEAALRLEEMRWQDEQRRRLIDLDRSRQKEQSLYSRWQDALRKRTRLEQEKAQIEQSSEALRVMLEELREHRDHTIALRQGGRLSTDHALAKIKGTLPWPANGQVTQNFGRQYSRDLNQLLVSNGIRIEAGAGKPVRAIGAGKVLFADAFRQYGQLVIIQHANGLTSVYGGLGQTQVQPEAQVDDLAPIGLVGASGSFYFELRREEEPLNPLVYLAPTLSTDLSSRRKFK